jgi:hypothetical protein
VSERKVFDLRELLGVSAVNRQCPLPAGAGSIRCGCSLVDENESGGLGWLLFLCPSMLLASIHVCSFRSCLSLGMLWVVSAGVGFSVHAACLRGFQWPCMYGISAGPQSSRFCHQLEVAHSGTDSDGNPKPVGPTIACTQLSCYY